MVGSLTHLICELNATAFLAKSSKPLTIICLKDPVFFFKMLLLLNTEASAITRKIALLNGDLLSASHEN